MKLLSPLDWTQYELIDSGNKEKLEKFGDYILWRPEPAAIWPRSMHERKWKEMASARFIQGGGQSGKWEMLRSLSKHWPLSYQYRDLNLKFRLKLTSFKHVGVFPEQAVNWNYIYETVKKMSVAKVLNLFAYTGGASMAARAGGADVIHCESVKQVVSWANQNMQSSRLKDIRWLVEDAFSFVSRQARKEQRYNGIILDPPTYGYGPKGERWKLEDQLEALMGNVARILDRDRGFLVLNIYSPGFSALTLYNIIHRAFGPRMVKHTEIGELFLNERSGRKLPAGVFARFRR